MDTSSRNTKKSSETGRSNSLALAVTVGLFAFLVTGDMDGGLTGVQGFFVGVFSVLSILGLLGLIESLLRKTGSAQKGKPLPPGQLLVTHSESDGGISINIYLGRELLAKVDRND